MTRKEMRQASREQGLDKLAVALKDAETFLNMAHGLTQGIDDAKGLEDCRSELSNASNAIDEAMGLIDELMAPEPQNEGRGDD